MCLFVCVSGWGRIVAETVIDAVVARSEETCY